MKVTLFRYYAKTSYHYIDVEIDSADNIVISGLVMGDESGRSSGDSDSEYWITVTSEYKQRVFTALREEYNRTMPTERSGLNDEDRAMLSLMGRLYGGRLSGYLEFCKLMETKGIPFIHGSYHDGDFSVNGHEE